MERIMQPNLAAVQVNEVNIYFGLGEVDEAHSFTL